METSQEHASLAPGRALKMAGLTAMACLLLASFSAAVPAVQMRMPMHSMPLFMDFTEEEAVADTKPMTNLEQVKDLLQNSQLPQFNETFLANLQSLKEQMEESEWKGFESWMRHWLIFQMAQQAPAPPTQKAPVLQTKCQVEAAAQGGSVWPGSFKPHCDELGNYMPMQCWHSTGYCWCVDKSGTEIANTRIRGRPDCNRAARRMMAFPTMIKLEAFSDGDE